jgi:hypothetical protein
MGAECNRNVSTGMIFQLLHPKCKSLKTTPVKHFLRNTHAECKGPNRAHGRPADGMAVAAMPTRSRRGKGGG